MRHLEPLPDVITAPALVSTTRAPTRRRRLRCRHNGRVDLIEVERVVLLAADHKYTAVHVMPHPDEPGAGSGELREYLIEPPLVELERELDPELFMRASRGALVNTRYLQGFTPLPDGRCELHLRNAPRLHVTASRRHAQAFREL